MNILRVSDITWFIIDVANIKLQKEKLIHKFILNCTVRLVYKKKKKALFYWITLNSPMRQSDLKEEEL